jgi:phosphoglycolate phosphatase-like HAD superfamily hydrolase
MNFLKAIIFDFDGVIAESVAVKVEAFRRMFEAKCPEHLEQILAYHKINGGISRYVKFQYIYDQFLKEPLSEAESQRLGGLFSQYVLEGVIAAPFVAGAKEFLFKYSERFSMFIVSGTPEDEMRLISAQRGLDRYFKGVYGSPRTKAELIRMILDEHKLEKEKVLFVGDSVNDYDGAKEAGIRFIGRVGRGEQNPFVHFNVQTIIRNLEQLETVLLEEGLV